MAFACKMFRKEQEVLAVVKAVVDVRERWSWRLGDTSESNGEHMCRAGTIRANVLRTNSPKKGKGSWYWAWASSTAVDGL